MKYNGQELQPITKPQIFDPPKEMLVWDSCIDEPKIRLVWAISPSDIHQRYKVCCDKGGRYIYCAEIPQAKQKLATNIQLMEWLAKGNGIWRNRNERNVRTFIYGDSESLEDEVEDGILIRPFGTKEWLEPTLENMGMVNHE